MANYLLDTDTCVALLRGKPQVSKQFQAHKMLTVAVSAVTAYELWVGAVKSPHPATEKTRVQALFSAVPIIEFDPAAAIRAAQTRASLETAGSPIGPYDLLIAGHALATRRVLVTHNTREFSRVPHLKLIDWHS